MDDFDLAMQIDDRKKPGRTSRVRALATVACAVVLSWNANSATQEVIDTSNPEIPGPAEPTDRDSMLSIDLVGTRELSSGLRDVLRPWFTSNTLPVNVKALMVNTILEYGKRHWAIFDKDVNASIQKINGNPEAIDIVFAKASINQQEFDITFIRSKTNNLDKIVDFIFRSSNDKYKDEEGLRTVGTGLAHAMYLSYAQNMLLRDPQVFNGKRTNQISVPQNKEVDQLSKIISELGARIPSWNIVDKVPEEYTAFYVDVVNHARSLQEFESIYARHRENIQRAIAILDKVHFQASLDINELLRSLRRRHELLDAAGVSFAKDLEKIYFKNSKGPLLIFAGGGVVLATEAYLKSIGIHTKTTFFTVD